MFLLFLIYDEDKAQKTISILKPKNTLKWTAKTSFARKLFLYGYFRARYNFLNYATQEKNFSCAQIHFVKIYVN